MEHGQLTQRIVASRAARIVALPTRTASVARANGKLITESAKWLVQSREHTNYTYDLTMRNLEHLAWWSAAVTGHPVGEMREYVAEIQADTALRSHVRAATMASDRRGLADLAVRYGRRIGWYAITRALRPAHVLETGTDKGLGSCVFAAALLKNGDGRLTTVDVNPASGYLISGRYATVVERRVGDSLTVLADAQSVDLLLHDSWHTFEHETAEYEAAQLATDALVLSDNAHATDALVRWAEANDRRFLFFREEPEHHWYPGSGIGAAW